MKKFSLILVILILCSSFSFQCSFSKRLIDPKSGFIINGDFEKGAIGWSKIISDPAMTRMMIADGIQVNGKFSAYIANKNYFQNNQVNSWIQQLRTNPKGNTVAFSGHLKTRSAKMALFEIQCLNHAGEVIASFESDKITASSGWKRLFMFAQIPVDAERILCKASLAGNGEAWFDRIQMLLVPNQQLHESDSVQDITDSGFIAF